MNNTNTLNKENDYIFDIDEHSFQKKVVEASTKKIILVDFWAPWCEPCKQLSPILEKIINDCEGRIHLAKMNIDKNQQIAAQLRIQSIPIVYAFKNKQIVDAFQGVLPPKKIIEFIEKVLVLIAFKRLRRFRVKIRFGLDFGPNVSPVWHQIWSNMDQKALQKRHPKFDRVLG